MQVVVLGFLEGSDLEAWEETTWRFGRREERLRCGRQKERKREKKRMIIMKRQRVSVGVDVGGGGESGVWFW